MTKSSSASAKGKSEKTSATKAAPEKAVNEKAMNEKSAREKTVSEKKAPERVVSDKSIKKSDLSKFQELLHEEKRKILHHLEELSESSELDLDQGSAGGDPVDIASLEINQANLQKIGKREAYLLKKIDLALRKIEDGTYGICENCGEDIGAPRLMARPVAQLCIDCKTEQENVERRYSSRQDEEEEEDSIYEESEDL